MSGTTLALSVYTSELGRSPSWNARELSVVAMSREVAASVLALVLDDAQNQLMEAVCAPVDAETQRCHAVRVPRVRDAGRIRA